MPELLEAPAQTDVDPFADIQVDPFDEIPADDPFTDIVSQSPTSESEKALAETPRPPSTLIKLEKGVENLSGMPIHQVMNATRVFGSAAGKYIFSGLQGLEIETAKALKNPPSELTTPQAEAVLLPQEEQDALEQKYIAETQAAIPDALARAEYWKGRAEGADEQSEVDPALANTIPARLSAVAGEATMMGMEALVPGVGLPLMVMHGALATEAEALNHGQTPEQAEAAAVRSAIGLAIFGGASKVAALGVAKLLPKAITDPSKLTKFMAQFVGQEAANESSSRVIAAWNAASDAPAGEKVEHALQALKDTTLEQSALNTAFALIGASKAAGARSLGTRPVNTTGVVTTKPPVGVTQLEARNPAIAARLAEERAVRPASEPEAVPTTESGIPAETARYTEPAQNLSQEAKPPNVNINEPIGVEAAIEEIQRRNAPEPISPLPAEASTANAAAQDAGKADIPVKPTGLKNEITAAERESRGLQPREEVELRSWETAKEIAENEAVTDHAKGERLVKELNEKPRPLDDVEGAHLLRRQVEVGKEHDAAIRAVNENPGDVAAITRLEEAREAAQQVYNAAEVSGTAWGRGGNIRKALMAQDFSLAKMEAETRAIVNKGKPLSPKQAAEVKETHDKIARVDDKIAASEGMGEFRESLRAARKTKGRFDPVAFMDVREARAMERIAARRGRLYSDPLGITQVAHLVDEAIIGAAHITRGTRNLKDWSSVMIKQFGEGIKPYLKALFKKAQSLHSEALRLGQQQANAHVREFKGLEGDKKRIRGTIAKYEERLETGDTSPLRPGREPRMDKEKSDLLFEREKIVEKYRGMLHEAKLRDRTPVRKVYDTAGDILGLVGRGLKTAYDVSAPGRQGLKLFGSNPIVSAKALKPMFESLRSDKVAFRIQAEIENSANWKNGYYKQAGLKIKDTTSRWAVNQDEIFQGRFNKFIPGVNASGRAFTTFLNKQATGVFDVMVAGLKDGGGTARQRQVIAELINIKNGRGNIKRLAGAMAELNKFYFAPTLELTGFQYALGVPFFKAGRDFKLQKIIALDYAKTLVGMGAFYSFLALLQDDDDPRVGLNPLKKDTFLTIRVGDTRYDLTAGMKQKIVATSQFIARDKIVKSGKHQDLSGEAKWGQDDLGDLLGSYHRSKLNPVLGSAYSAHKGEDFKGDKTSWAKELMSLPIPISLSSVYEILRDNGLLKGIIPVLISELGGTVNSYPDRPKTADSLDDVIARKLGVEANTRQASTSRPYSPKE